MLYLVGLGLCDAKDITLRGLEIVQQCTKVYLEAYTSILNCDVTELERVYKKSITLADREFVEQGSDSMLREATTEDVALLVVGDPLGATTHTDLLLRARELKVPYTLVHNTSILTAVGCCGLQLYRYGETVSLPLWTDQWKPTSFHDRLVANHTRGLHTLCLLDIKVKEQSVENLIKGRKIYEPPRYMTSQQAARQILESAVERGDDVITPNTLAIGLARVGLPDQKIVFGNLTQLSDYDMGKPLHCLVIPAPELHDLELQYIEEYRISKLG